MKISPYSDVSFEQTTSAPNQRIKHIILQLATVTLMTIGSGLLVNLCLRYDMLYGDHTLGEVSLTECVQQILLGITVIAFYRIRSQRQDLRHSALLIAGFFLVLFIRELDFLFDKIAHGFWVYPALAVTCAAIIIRQTANLVFLRDDLSSTEHAITGHESNVVAGFFAFIR
jgi:hypothetical protein